MPFQPILEVEIPNWLYAKTHRVLGLTGLIVYRSTAVRDTDRLYAPVQKVLDEGDWSEVNRETIETKDMMWELAELALYTLGIMDSDIEMADVVAELRAEARRFLEL